MPECFSCRSPAHWSRRMSVGRMVGLGAGGCITPKRLALLRELMKLCLASPSGQLGWWKATQDWGLCLPNSQSVIKCGTFSAEWHLHFHVQSSQDYFFFFPKGSIFLVSFILPSLQQHTYLLLSSLALALWRQTCLHVNLLCKSVLSEVEEIVRSCPISQICFFLQADGLARVSLCLSHAVGGFTPAGRWAASAPVAALPTIFLQARAMRAAPPPAAPQGAALGPWCGTPTIFCYPPGIPRPVCLPVRRSSAPLCRHDPKNCPLLQAAWRSFSCRLAQRGEEFALSLRFAPLPPLRLCFSAACNERREHCRPVSGAAARSRAWRGRRLPQPSEGRAGRAVQLTQAKDGGLGNQNLNSPNCVILPSLR